MTLFSEKVTEEVVWKKNQIVQIPFCFILPEEALCFSIDFERPGLWFPDADDTRRQIIVVHYTYKGRPLPTRLHSFCVGVNTEKGPVDSRLVSIIQRRSNDIVEDVLFLWETTDVHRM